MHAPIPQHQPVPNRFLGKVAIVTGGAAGIGRAIVEEFCKEGGRVAFSDLQEAAVLEVESGRYTFGSVMARVPQPPKDEKTSP